MRGSRWSPGVLRASRRVSIEFRLRFGALDARTNPESMMMHAPPGATRPFLEVQCDDAGLKGLGSEQGEVYFPVDVDS